MLIFIFGNYPLILVFISGHSYMSISAAFLAIVTSSIFVLFDTRHGSCLYFIDYEIRHKFSYFQIAILDVLMLIVT